MAQKQTLWTKNFSCITLATVFSIIGGEVMTLPLSLLVFEETRSTMLSAVIMVCGMLPDVLFSVLGTACFLLLLLRGTDGRLRFYLPLGLIVGFFLYRETISSGVLHIILRLLKLAGNIADDLWAFVLWAFSFPRGN